MNRIENEFYEKSILIREFEKLLLNLFDKGYLYGTTHTAIGQELISVAILRNLSSGDTVISNHRSHAHFIAYSNEIEGLFKELLGLKDGICGGKSGSQHIHYKNFLSNGVLGNLLPVAAGIALSNKISMKNNIVYIFLGDGVFGQGVLYETLNFCSLNNLKCFFIVENNFIAQTTPLEKNFAGKFEDRFNAFKIKSKQLSTNNIKKFVTEINKIKEKINKLSQPHALIVNTQRIAAHSKGDDTREKKIINNLLKKDSLINLEKKLDKNFVDKTKRKVKEFYSKLLKTNNINYELY